MRRWQTRVKPPGFLQGRVFFTGFLLVVIPENPVLSGGKAVANLPWGAFREQLQPFRELTGVGGVSHWLRKKKLK